MDQTHADLEARHDAEEPGGPAPDDEHPRKAVWKPNWRFTIEQRHSIYDFIVKRCRVAEWNDIRLKKEWPKTRKRIAEIFVGVEDFIAVLCGQNQASDEALTAATAAAAAAARGDGPHGDDEMDDMPQQGVEPLGRPCA